MAEVPTTGLHLQPRYNFIPGYIVGPKTVLENNDGTEKKIKVLALITLKLNSWESLNNRKEILKNKKIVYIKILQNEVVEVGMHLLHYQNIQKLKLVRILLGQMLLPQDTKVMVLHGMNYQETIDNFFPEPAKEGPLANPRVLPADSSSLIEHIALSNLIKNPNITYLPGIIINIKNLTIEENGIKSTAKTLNILPLTDTFWAQLDEFGRKFIIDNKEVTILKLEIIKGQMGLTVGIGLHFSKYNLINNLGYRILLIDKILHRNYPIALMDENEYANAVSQIWPSIPAAPLKSRSIVLLGCLSPGYLEMTKRNNENEICLMVVMLSRKIWSQLNEGWKEELINEKKLVWIKYTQDQKQEATHFSSKFVQKIEMHETAIAQIEEVKANSDVLINPSVGFVVRKEFGDDIPHIDEYTLLPENTSIVLLQDKRYAKRIKKFIPILSTPNPLGNSIKEADESLISMLSSNLEEKKED